MASRALEVINSGSSFGALDRGVLSQFDGYEYFNPWLSSAIQSLGIRIFGEPSLLAMRSVSLISGFVLLIAIYFIGFALDGRRLGILSVAFTAFSWPFSLSAHFGRPDIIAATFGYVALAVHLNNRKSSKFLSALAGLLSSLAFEVHPHAAIFIPTILALFIYEYKTRIFKRADFWAYIGGVLVGLMIFVALHILPAPYTYFKLSQIVFSESHIPPLFTFDFSIIIDSFRGMALMVVFAYPQVILGILTIYRMIRTRPPYMGRLLVLTGSLLIFFTLLVRNKFLLYYAILHSPVLSLFLAAFFNDFLRTPVKKKFEKRFRELIVVAILFLPMHFIVRFNFLPSYQQLQSDVKQIVKTGDVIMANQLYWFGLREHTYYSWENIAFYRRYYPESNLVDLFQQLKPDIFIIDSQVENFLLDKNEGNPYYEAFKIPKTDLEAFLDQYATQEKELNIDNDNPVRIFRINLEELQTE